MKVYEDEKTDRFGNYPIWIKGKDANLQKIYEELWTRYGGQGYKFAILFDCSKDEYEDLEKETPVYFLDDILDEIISHCGLENVRRRLDELTSQIIRKHMNDGWILVEERMPEGGEEVLVQWEFYSRCDNMTYTYIHIMRLNKMTGEWNGTYGVPNGKVIAWRPLPDPYCPETKSC